MLSLSKQRFLSQVELGTLQDTVPTDRIVTLQGGWGLFKERFSGEILLRLTYKAYVEDEEDDGTKRRLLEDDVSDDDISDVEEKNRIKTSTNSGVYNAAEKESFMDKFAALLVSEEFQGIFASEAGSMRNAEEFTPSQPLDFNPEDETSTTQFMDNEKDREGKIGSSTYMYE
eukprot:Gb_01150 [translate_table: standard]